MNYNYEHMQLKHMSAHLKLVYIYIYVSVCAHIHSLTHIYIYIYENSHIARTYMHIYTQVYKHATCLHRGSAPDTGEDCAREEGRGPTRVHPATKLLGGTGTVMCC